MLKGLLRGWWSRARSARAASDERQALFERARQLVDHGDRRAAMAALEAYLDRDPSNVYALNNLGVCCIDTGDLARAHQLFERAYSLDDNFVPGVINRAKVLADQRRSEQALPLVRHALLGHPRFVHSHAVYGGILFNNGQVPQARRHHLLAWMANFDALRHANCYLFHSTYDDIDERLIASEHRFWAQTLAPPGPARGLAVSMWTPDPPFPPWPVQAAPGTPSAGRLRIGYWSPDLRGHSVRYFLQPLLVHHDRQRFETVLLHDSPLRDAHTDRLQAAADQFHDVHDRTDQDLTDHIRSLDLDILVDLAGHTSSNRVNLLNQRLARLQISALGYPPTTGLDTIDAKVIDRHVATPQDNLHYTEYPLVLPTSFWCFDPMEDAPVEPMPPARRRGFVTFACVGNIAKITDRILAAWGQILAQIPGSRLLLRSISFEDPAAVEAFRLRLQGAGFDLACVDLLGPAGGQAFFASYHEVDIVLDTFPFNGGTTTCFATYMGVPVVSLSGRSLVSRMGRSVLTNLGLQHLVVDRLEDYVRVAVDLAHDLPFLEQFRRDARRRYQSSALGNGALYAREFEAACEQLLQLKRTGALHWRSRVEPLPADEIVKRAYKVSGFGLQEAAVRMAEHALRHHPQSASAHLFMAQRRAATEGPAAALAYLRAQLSGLQSPGRVPALIMSIRYSLLLRQLPEALQTWEQLRQEPIADEFDRLQASLYGLHLRAPAASKPRPAPTLAVAPKRVCVLVVSEDEQQYRACTAALLHRCPVPPDWEVQTLRCDPQRRHQTYGQVARTPNLDMALILHPHVLPWRPDLLVTLADAIGQHDIVGFFGCNRWDRPDWRGDQFARKAAGFSVPCAEAGGMIDLLWLGATPGAMVGGMAVLDGGLLAVRPEMLLTCTAEPDLEVNLPLYEEVWTHLAYRAGHRLAVHRALGLEVRPASNPGEQALPTALRAAADRLGLDPFGPLDADGLYLALPLEDMEQACAVQQAWSGHAA